MCLDDLVSCLHTKGLLFWGKAVSITIASLPCLKSFSFQQPVKQRHNVTTSSTSWVSNKFLGIFEIWNFSLVNHSLRLLAWFLSKRVLFALFKSLRQESYFRNQIQKVLQHHELHATDCYFLGAFVRSNLRKPLCYSEHNFLVIMV